MEFLVSAWTNSKLLIPITFYFHYQTLRKTTVLKSWLVKNVLIQFVFFEPVKVECLSRFLHYLPMYVLKCYSITLASITVGYKSCELPGTYDCDDAFLRDSCTIRQILSVWTATHSRRTGRTFYLYNVFRWTYF